mmetsp:Transcript_16070/g.15791  ORF Transcript_16070/g.15791 Transcript_16070/m.15791 type:complete len:83 (+) Transcript_16070:3-251(+)
MEFQRQALIASVFMIVIPFSAFFYTRNYLRENVFKHEEYYTSLKNKSQLIDTYSAIAAVIGVWVVIVGVILVKHSDDFIEIC